MSGSVEVQRRFDLAGMGEEATRRRRRGGEEDDEEEEDEEERGMEAWERAYADERSWEDLQEDESGLLRPIDTKTLVHAQYRRRLLQKSAASAASRIQKGLIRYLYLVVDLSRNVVLLDWIRIGLEIPARATLDF
ncbi:hypothetical protein B296_00039708 [Ensete ventricosum]|uniref:Uncharacterized protein n=1 Tax=Ensete ventricosum TaxID=4639 RepID=A0A426ZQP5_ENSVE|nr:hypothetical protein B296_00039708 [Ensete ventricosum]